MKPHKQWQQKQIRTSYAAIPARSPFGDVVATQPLPPEEVQHERENVFVD
ncbi:hypothetical protein [Paraburkholderia flava]|nr:hypothetical protein [Paraburkholderia flava]